MLTDLADRPRPPQNTLSGNAAGLQFKVGALAERVQMGLSNGRRNKVRLMVVLLFLSAFSAKADVTDIDLIEPGLFPIFNMPIMLRGQPAMVSFTPRKEPTTFVIDETDLKVTESKGFIEERRPHSLVADQNNVRILILRADGKER